MKRVFAIDVLVCARCSGPTRIIAHIHSPAAIRAILECLGLPARAPPLAPARSEIIDEDQGEHRSSDEYDPGDEASSTED